mgnify:CR=1 FL=1
MSRMYQMLLKLFIFTKKENALQLFGKERSIFLWKNLVDLEFVKICHVHVIYFHFLFLSQLFFQFCRFRIRENMLRTSCICTWFLFHFKAQKHQPGPSLVSRPPSWAIYSSVSTMFFCGLNFALLSAFQWGFAS